MNRILALDLDDTLLRTDKTVSPTTRRWLGAWLDRGHEIVVATGRPPRSVEEVLPDELRTATRVVYNGAQVIEQGSTVYHNLIAPADVAAVLDWIQICAPDWCMGVEIDDQLFLSREINKPGAYQVVDLRTVCDRPAAKILFLFPNERHDIGPLLAAIPRTTRALVTPKFRMVQLCSHTTDKATALDFLMQRRGRDLKSVIAIGDDVNDVEMVQRCGVGVAVDNALPEVKAVADLITLSNDEDGVAATIEQLLLNDEPGRFSR